MKTWCSAASRGRLTAALANKTALSEMVTKKVVYKTRKCVDSRFNNFGHRRRGLFDFTF